MTKLVEFNSKFIPTDTMLMAKARLHKNVEGIFMNVADMSMAQIANFAGITMAMLERWGQTEGWAPWFFETDTAEKRIASMKELAVKELYDILTAPRGDGKDGITVPSKDKLKAVELLVQVADMMPNKRKTVEFLDKSLGKMDDDEVDVEMGKLKGKLKAIDSGGKK